MTRREQPKIALPEWYACFSTSWQPEMRGGTDVRVGPLTIFASDRGCDVAAFGGGRSVALFDGFLFDRERLAAECGCEPSASHAALAAAAYERWGVAAFDKLDGCYLAAIWDDARGELFLGHDALGRHPVFYAAGGDRVWFGPNIVALTSNAPISRAANRLSLALSALQYWPEAGETFFEHVRRVEPGHYLRISSQHACTSIAYWNPYPADDEPWMPDERAVEEFEPTLTAAVNRCMALGPGGIMLSGGVDSVTIAALAAVYWRAHGLAPIVGVSGRTGYALSPEEQMQGRVTDALGMPSDVSTTLEWQQGRDDVSLSLEMADTLPAPTHIYWVGTYTRFYRRTSASGITVLLTGAGGDNWLGVAYPYAAELLQRFQLRKLAVFLRLSVETAGYPFGFVGGRIAWRNGVRPLLDSCWAKLAPRSKQNFHRRRAADALPAWACPEPRLRAELVERLVGRRTPSLTAEGRIPRSYYRHTVRETPNSFMHHENETGFHMETSCGVRLLSPYHDKQFVSFCNRISPDVLVHRNRYKGLLRPIVGRALPGLGLENQKKQAGLHDGGRALRAFRAGIAAAGAGQEFDRLAELGVIRPDHVKQSLGRVDETYDDDLAVLFTMMCAERWLGARASG